MDKKAKVLLNSLRCPLCGSGVDKLNYERWATGDWNSTCAQNNEHYRIELATDNQKDHPYNRPIDPFIAREKVRIYHGDHLYVIWQSHYHTDLGRSDGTFIESYDVDGEKQIVSSVYGMTNIKFSCDTVLFDFQQATQDKILARIKTILTFG